MTTSRNSIRVPLFVAGMVLALPAMAGPGDLFWGGVEEADVMEETVDLDICTRMPIQMTPEACELTIGDVTLLCDECNFELRPNDECMLQKVLVSAEGCRVRMGGEDIPTTTTDDLW